MACLLNNNTIEIIDDTPLFGATTGFNGTATYKFGIIYNEIITFNITLNNIGGGLPSAILKLYKINLDNTIDIVGTASLTGFNNTFTYDAILGDYMVCLQSIHPVNYSIELNFTTYAGVLIQPLIAYNGQEASSAFKQPISSQCQSDVNFEFLHGELPVGFKFRSDGIIFGQAEEQDCESDSNEAPSYTWAETNDDGELESTGRPYEFTLRAFLEDYPEVFDDRVFQLCVRNNWSYDVTKGDALNTEYECVILE